MSSVRFWLLLIFVSSALSEEIISVVNDYIDEVLSNLKNDKETSSKFDPVRIPDINEKNFKGWNIYIKGLSSLYRAGDCVVITDGDIITVKGDVAVANIEINLDYKAKTLFWISGIIRAKLDKLAVFVQATLDQKEGKTSLQEFKVTQFGTIAVTKITGLSVVLNWLLKIIVNRVINNAKSRIIHIMETEVPKMIIVELEKITIPV